MKKAKGKKLFLDIVAALCGLMLFTGTTYTEGQGLLGVDYV